MSMLGFVEGPRSSPPERWVRPAPAVAPDVIPTGSGVTVL